MFDFFAVLEQINPGYILAILAGCFLLFMGLSAITGAWQTPPMPPKKAMLQTLHVLRQSFIQGLQEGWRGYFAPLRRAPWRAARQAWCQPNATWLSPFSAWLAEIDRITKGPRN